MAGPSKRPRDVFDIDGDTEVEIESASSSFRQNNNHKRTKIALARERGGSTVSDDDDEDEGQYDDYDDLLNDSDADQIASQGFSRDGSDVEHEEDEIDELLATQIVEKQFRDLKDNIAAEEGVIEEIVCKNFMCHAFLRIKLGPLINFIIGHNGSGKSAVLTALTMCLGGKAAQTNRGASLKSLIKEGQESATLEVKIKNTGENAYKQGEYGNSIIVERHFSRSGASGFKLKSEKNKTVSTKKADLDDILDYFGLQLDNPINVLTQDMARSFLSNSTPTDKYKFFIKGTGLETLDADYKLFEEQLDNMEEKLRVRDGDIEVIKQKFDEAERRKKEGRSLELLHQRMRETMRHFSWAQVQEQEDQLRQYEENVAAAENQVAEFEEAARTADDNYDAENTAHEAATRAINEHQEQLQPATEAHTAAKEKFDSNKEALTRSKAEQRSIKTSLNNAKTQMQKLRHEVQVEKERLEAAEGDAHIRRMEELEELKSVAEASRQAEQDHLAQRSEIQQALATAEENVKQAKEAQRDTNGAVLAAQGALRDLEREQGSMYGAYHPRMQDLCKAINKETRWRLKPVGPLGMHVTLQKPEWSSVLEKTFGGILNAFTVTCKDDQTILSQLAKRCGCPADVFIQRAEPLNYHDKEPADRDVDTIMRVLKFNNEAVRNVLIINQSIEQVVLIKNGEEASEYQLRRHHHVKAALALTANSNKTSGTRYDFSRMGEARSSPIEVWTGAVRMKTDQTERKRLQQDRVNGAVREHDAATQHVRTRDMELKSAREKQERYKRRANELKTQKQRDEDRVEEKQAEIDGNRPQDGRLQELERQLEDASAEEDTAKSSYQDCETHIATLNEAARELKQAADAALAEVNAIQGRIDQAKEKVRRCEAARHEALLAKNEAHDNIAGAKELAAQKSESRDRQKTRVEEYITDATQISPRVATEWPEVSVNQYEERYTNLREQFKRAEQRLGSREEISRIWAERHKEYQDALSQTKELKAIANKLKKALTERHRRWGLFRKYISVRARINFGYLLSERNFRGRVMLAHSEKKLEISVEPDINRASDAGRQAKTLSGGEKSFSTICLLLSIWEAMGSPIRCLDEFDVFMDSVNRAESMRLMIQAARRSVGRQFILITPQSMSNVDSADDVMIHRMGDPERGQTTLAFHGQQV